MRIEQLQYVVAVTRHGSLRRASERLHVSQPALSEAVGKLERELGVTLLDRRRSGAHLSRAGHDLLPHLTDVLHAVDRLRAAAGDEVAAHRVVRVGTVDATSTVLLPGVRGLSAAHRGATVEVRTLPPTGVVAALAAGSIDVGLVTALADDDTPADLDRTVLVEGEPVVVLPSGHPLAGRRRVRPDDLRAHALVGLRPGHLAHRYVHRLLGSALPAFSHTTDGVELAVLAVAEGMGITVLPDFSVVDHPVATSGRVTTRPLGGEHPRVRLLLLQRRGARVPDPVASLVAALVDASGRPSAAGAG